MSSSLVSDAMRHASFNIAFQISTRILTFILNIYILRYVSAYTLGVINVRLLLLYTTTQFISREPMRRVCISEAKSYRWPSLVNLVWLNIITTFIFGFGLSYIWLNWVEQPDGDQAFGYRFAVLFMPIVVSIEMVSEPMFIYCQLQNHVKTRINIEAIALIIRCLVMTLFIRSYPSRAIVIFMSALTISAISLTLMYHIYFAFKMRLNIPYSHCFPDRNAQPLIDRNLAKLNASFFSQTIIKQFLTEGEKFIMTFLNPMTFDEQGIYDIVNNLGSLAARFIFQPIEESAYILFGKLIVRGKGTKQQDARKYKIAMDTLRDLLKLMSLCGLIILVFGFNYSQLALKIYNEKHLGRGLAIELMRWHCVYIYLIAINGISETFTFAVMSKGEIDRFNVWLIGFSVIYLVVVSTSTRIIGAAGLIVANCVNMICRIVFSCKFISKCISSEKKHDNPLLGIIPHHKILTASSITFGLTRLSETTLCCSNWTDSIIHVIFGGLLFFLISIIIYCNEPKAIEMMDQIPLFRIILKFVKPKKVKDQ